MFCSVRSHCDSSVFVHCLKWQIFGRQSTVDGQRYRCHHRKIIIHNNSASSTLARASTLYIYAPNYRAKLLVCVCANDNHKNSTRTHITLFVHCLYCVFNVDDESNERKWRYIYVWNKYRVTTAKTTTPNKYKKKHINLTVEMRKCTWIIMVCPSSLAYGRAARWCLFSIVYRMSCCRSVFICASAAATAASRRVNDARLSWDPCECE